MSHIHIKGDRIHGFLRDSVPLEQRAEWEQRIEHLRHCSKATRPKQKALMLGRLGDELRRAPECSAEAVEASTRALAIAKQLHEPEKNEGQLVAANWIRFATALQYDGQHEEAIEAFYDAHRWIQTLKLKEYEDFVLQHMGKCLVESGQLKHAQVCFEQALNLRLERGDERLIESTHKAIKGLCALKLQLP